jgi:hypothetical protein
MAANCSLSEKGAIPERSLLLRFGAFLDGRASPHCVVANFRSQPRFNPRGSAKPLNPTRSSCALLRKDRLLFYQTSRQGEIDDREGFPTSSS